MLYTLLGYLSTLYNENNQICVLKEKKYYYIMNRTDQTDCVTYLEDDHDCGEGEQRDHADHQSDVVLTVRPRHRFQSNYNSNLFLLQLLLLPFLLFDFFDCHSGAVLIVL